MSLLHPTSLRPSGTRRAATLAGLLLSASCVHQTVQAQPITASPVTVTKISMVRIGGHVPELVRTSRLLGLVSPDQPLAMTISLPLRNQAALADFLKRVYDPSDPLFGHYLTMDQFAARFGPTQADYDAVIAYVQSKGLRVAQTWPEHTLLSISGTAAQANTAFGVSLKQFQSPAGRVFRAPDTEVTLPAALAGKVIGVVGLDDASPPQPLATPIRAASGEATSLAQSPPEQGTGPGGGFSPSDLRTAYNTGSLGLNGAGQTIAMIEYGTAFNQKDILRYELQFGLPRAAVTPVVVNTPVTTYSSASTETDLDIDMQLAMAPGASQILVYESGGQTLPPIQQAATENRAKQVSISYGFGAESRTSATPSATQSSLNTVFTQMAAQGQSVFVSSGDSGDTPRSTTTYVGVDILASQPLVCSVGGTALLVNSPGANESYLTESTWNYNSTAAGGGGGGGISNQWPIPSYQTAAASFALPGTNVSQTRRNLPDVSAVASPYTGVALYSSVDPTLNGPGWYIFGGTSASAPLWAGFCALVNQNRALNGLPPLGLPNMSLYPLAYNASGLTGDYAQLFHDVNDGSSNSSIAGGTLFSALTGFDDSTGLGSFQGFNLLFALSGGAPVIAPPGSGPTGMAMGSRRTTALHLADFVLPAPVRDTAALRKTLRMH